MKSFSNFFERHFLQAAAGVLAPQKAVPLIGSAVNGD